jgi:hypothetical protein
MSLRKDTSRPHLGPFVLVYLALVVIGLAVILLAVFTDIFTPLAQAVIPQPIWFALAVLGVLVLIASAVGAFRLLAILRQNAARLEKVINSLEKTRASITEIDHNTRISESARAIAHRDSERQSLREAVFDKLQQKDFEATYQMIGKIADTTVHKDLAQQLKTEVDNYKGSSGQQRVDQDIAHIDTLFENHQWAKASESIEKLIASSPDSEKARAMRQKLVDKKEERKKVLLNAWDDAVRRQATDRGLEILHELDSYLTPNEALALQEAASDVFRNKLHNLGVQYSLAVSGKQWAKAVETGLQIIQRFPNSKMAQEIREKMDILKANVARP